MMDKIMPYLLYIKLIGIAALVSSLLLIGHHYGAQGVQSKWNAYKLVQSELQRKLILSAVAAKEAENKLDIQQSQKVVKNYEDTIDLKNAQITAARAYANSRQLRINRAAICDRAPATGQAASAVIADEKGAATVELPKEIADGLRSIAEDADREIARKDGKIEGLHQWAIDHGFAP